MSVTISFCIAFEKNFPFASCLFKSLSGLVNLPPQSDGREPIPREDYERLIDFLQDYNPPAILPIQIAYYAGLRIGEACGLAWQDVNLEEQCLTIRQSIRYDGSRHKNIIGPTKRKKVRIVDFGDTLQCPKRAT
ncbi:tyrosine-type recombinase/integrase [Pseudoramibacter faecis]|uniref:tyrosine-type recombinase/integrase n=1 Tax=Pseudoramibacter faecis TaxID=3108534 RepID=UPI003CC94BD3